MGATAITTTMAITIDAKAPEAAAVMVRVTQ